MSRIVGDSIFPANFEPRKAMPFDARSVVDTRADLSLLITWNKGDGNAYVYKGMLVSVTDDALPENNGVYRLLDLDYTQSNNWEKLGGGGGGGLSQVQTIAELELLGADEGDLISVIDEDSIYQFHEDDISFIINGLSVTKTLDGNNSRWVCISGKNTYYGYIKRIDVAVVDFEKHQTNYPLTTSVLEAHSIRDSNFFSGLKMSYSEVSDILFYDIIVVNDGTQVITKSLGKRFSTIATLVAEINTLAVDDGGVFRDDITVNCYLKQDTYNSNSMSRVNAYNQLFTQIKGKAAGSGNKRIATLQNIEDIHNTFNQRDNLVNYIYSEFLSVPNGIAIPNVLSTIGCTTSVRNKMYSLLPVGTSLGYRNTMFEATSNDRQKRLYNQGTGVVTGPPDSSDNIPLYILESKVYGRLVNSINPDTPITQLGENPGIDELISYSAVRVYRLVDDINNPILNYFLIKPIGVDCFVTAYSIIGARTNNSRCGIFVSDNYGIKALRTFEPEYQFYISNNRGFRINLDHYKTFLSPGTLTTVPASQKMRSFKFFHYDADTGIISQFTPIASMQKNVAGSRYRIMLNSK